MSTTWSYAIPRTVSGATVLTTARTALGASAPTSSDLHSASTAAPSETTTSTAPAPSTASSAVATVGTSYSRGVRFHPRTS